LHTRIYIAQLFGLLLLICGYFLSDPPDSLSVMHFDPNPACPSVITKAVKTNVNNALQTISSSQEGTSRKTNTPKYISFELILPQVDGYHYREACRVVYTCILPENYRYLFFEEINPPPPKDC